MSRIKAFREMQARLNTQPEDVREEREARIQRYTERAEQRRELFEPAIDVSGLSERVMWEDPSEEADG